MKAIDKKDLSDIHRRIDVINSVLIQMAVTLRVELGNLRSEDMIEELEQNTYDNS